MVALCFSPTPDCVLLNSCVLAQCMPASSGLFSVDFGDLPNSIRVTSATVYILPVFDVVLDCVEPSTRCTQL